MKRTSKKLPKHKSKFETSVSEYFKNKLPYEPRRISFVQPAIKRAYVPDFELGPNIYLECKGYFDTETRKKHLWFRDSNPDIKIIFLFMDANKKIHSKSNTTYADWCNKNGFEWYCWKHRKPTFDLVSKDNRSTKTPRRTKSNNLLDR